MRLVSVLGVSLKRCFLYFIVNNRDHFSASTLCNCMIFVSDSAFNSDSEPQDVQGMAYHSLEFT